MIICKNGHFILHTKKTTYAFHVMETGHLEHLYYGKRLKLDESLTGVDVLKEKWYFAPGNTVFYDNDHCGYTLENVRLEMSSYGHGDIREPFITIVHSDGSQSSDFLYDSYEYSKGKKELMTMPSSYGSSDEVEELVIVLKDKQYDLELELHYCVFENCDVITRYALIKNTSKEVIRVNRLMSLMLDMSDGNYELTTFHGNWIKEMTKETIPTHKGKYVGMSMTGTSSSRNNPLFLLAKPKTTENQGGCYGFNLVYSGNHYESVEVSTFDKLRVVSGICPEGFSFVLNPDEELEAPEAVMTYSDDGYNGMSQNMHAFVRKHIVRGEWKDKVRPILLNSWEAAYFDINEDKLVNLAKAAAGVGIELLVMDDGWFGTRSDDSQSLGDWYPDKNKLPNGVKGLCDKINEVGLDFGIWVEPEMVNVKSNLYKAHPDWCLAIPNKHHSEGRWQRVLDMGRTEVQDYIIEAMSDVFSSANISYVKWDMNRNITDYYSEGLPIEKQGEVAHRYVLGLYRVMKTLTEKFPHILFEGCSSGGNRFDLGILSYFPQIWGSDNSDAMCRVNIQNGYSYGYPPETIGAHVSASPNHQTMRETPIETRFAVACFGALGYEYNLCELDEETLEKIASQVKLYKELRQTMQYGSMYRGRSFDEGNICEWTIVSKDKTKAVGALIQNMQKANAHYQYFKPSGLDSDTLYSFSNKYKDIKMYSENDDVVCPGEVLMDAGVNLRPAFGGVGFNESVRYFPDFASRLYFMEKVKE